MAKMEYPASFLRFINDWSLALKLKTIIMGVCSVALIGLTILLTIFTLSMYRHHMLGELSAASRIIAYNSAAAVQFDDISDATDILNALSEDSTIQFARITRADGSILASYHKQYPKAVAKKMANHSGTLTQDAFITVEAPIMLNQQQIGSVFISADDSNLITFRKFQLIVISILLTAVLISAYWLSSLLLRIISGPLEQLTGLVRSVSETQDYSLRTPLNSKDEIGSLALAFNAMLGEVEHRDTALKHAENYIANIINSMPSMLISVDANKIVTHWNDEASRQTGIKNEGAMGRPLSQLLPDIDEEIPQIKTLGAGPRKLRLRHDRKSEAGRICNEEIALYPITSNHTEGAVILIDDVTERVQMEEQLNHSQKMDAIGQLAGGVAHDFNNMLGGIIGGADLLQPWIPNDPKPQQYLKTIRTAAERAANLSTQLLSFSHKHPIVPTQIDLHQIITEATDILSSTIDKRVTIELKLSAEDSSIVGDPTLLGSIFINLGINASHAMPQGGTLSVETRTRELDAAYCDPNPFKLTPGKYLEIDIRDTGCGIPSNLIDHIFEPFFTTKEQGKGTGLGLTTAYATVKRHGGEITVSSEINVGTCFQIHLPLSQMKTVHEPTEVVSHKGEGLVLIVDDEEIMRSTLQAYIEEYGYEVILAKDGEEAIERYEKYLNEIVFVICDMIMPRLSGPDCFRALKKINPEVRVILASGFAHEEDVNQVQKEGVAAFIHKPYRNKELVKAIKKAIGKE